MAIRRQVRIGMAGVTLAACALCWWSAAPLWLVAVLLVAGAVVAMRPLGRMVPDEEIDVLRTELSDERSGVRPSRADGDSVLAVVTPIYMTIPRREVVRRGGLALQQRSLLLRDEVHAEQWHALATLLRMQPASVKTRANPLIKIIDFALAKPK